MIDEVERLKNLMAEMSLMIGMMRGMLMTVKLESEQIEMLKRIDKAIERIFYSDRIREKENV